MATRGDIEQRAGIRLAYLGRAVLAILAIFVGLAGVVSLALEQEYGGSRDRPEFVIEETVDPPAVRVYSIDEGTGATEPAFEGTSRAEAEDWVAGQRGSRNFAVPLLLIAGSLGMFAVAFWPIIRRAGHSA